MTGFLESLARQLYSKYGNNIGDVTIVFPNRRAGLFFNNYLERLVDETLFAPEVTSINDLFFSSSKFVVADSLSLVFRLYKVYCDVTKTKETLDDFYFWGEVLINDFNDVDKYMVDASGLFSNISELKEIEERFSTLEDDAFGHVSSFWKNVNANHRGSGQKEFIKVWHALSSVYKLFREALEAEGLAYEGMIYRDVAERISNGEGGILESRRFVLAGFNALNRCEELLFDYLKDNEQAEFYWDFDKYYVEDRLQEAGMFVRKNLERFPQSEFPYGTNDFHDVKKEIRIVNVSSNVGQSQVAAAELVKTVSKDTKDTPHFDDTAVVLCDEGLLLPVMGAIPLQLEKVNVTLGFPFASSPVYSFVVQLMDMQKGITTGSSSGVAFYRKNVLAVINHQIVAQVDPDVVDELNKHIISRNRLYLEEEELGRSDFLKLLFCSPGEVGELHTYFIKLTRYIFEFFSNSDGMGTDVNREYLYCFYLILIRLRDTIEKDGVKLFGGREFIGREIWFKLLQRYMERLSVPLEGEPLEGLQIMGVLETRNLDFKNIIMTSVNEGVMPGSSVNTSFIPYNLRKGFGLPTVEEHNAMYAYYFYRVLQRAERVTFIYNSNSEGLLTGEKSRYLYQLLMESGMDIEESTFVYDANTTLSAPISISKSDRVMEPLQHYFDGSRTLSPSAIDRYITCPLQFCLRYSFRLKEPDRVADEVDAMYFGNIFHEAMEKLYSPFLGRCVNEEDVDSIIDNEGLVEDTITGAFSNCYFKDGGEGTQITGRNLLVYEVVKKYILQVLQIDKRRTPFEVLGLEKHVETTLSFSGGTVHIGGIIDRLDRKDGLPVILDYKTGKSDISFGVVEELFDREKKNRNKAAFQAMFYSYVFSKSSSRKDIVPGIYILRSIFERDFDPSLKCKKEDGNIPVKFAEKVERFESGLTGLLEEIFDNKVAFYQTEDENSCRICPYKGICRRGE